MALEINLKLEDKDLERFRNLFAKAREKAEAIDTQTLLQSSQRLVDAAIANDPPEFVHQRLEGLKQLVTMVEDDAWGLPTDERDRILEALAYFATGNDVIPDTTPVLGLLDDAIAAELVLRALRHELEAYEEFSRFRNGEIPRRTNAGKPTDVSKEDWLADKRATLHSRMRERRLAEPQGWHTITLWGND